MKLALIVFATLFVPALATAKEVSIPAVPGAFALAIRDGSVAAGDVATLAPGNHGEIVMSGVRFDPPVTVRGREGARLSRLVMRDSSGWVWRGLTIVSDGSSDGALVRVRDSQKIAIEGFDIASGRGVERWTRAQWLDQVRDGIEANGRDIRVIGNRLTGVFHGIGASGSNVHVEGNEISWFAGDGIRALADNAVYRGNRIETCVKINDNHDDGIQSWSRGPDGRPGSGVVRNVLIEGNTIRNGHAGRLTCTLQGIGFFDGMFEDLTIRRNVIVVNHWHGITVMGARRVTIDGNLVVDAAPGTDGTPWIAITAHKDGRSARDSLISNNISQPFAGGSNPTFRQPQPGVRLKDNRVVPTAEAGIELWNREN